MYTQHLQLANHVRLTWIVTQLALVGCFNMLNCLHHFEVLACISAHFGLHGPVKIFGFFQLGESLLGRPATRKKRVHWCWCLVIAPHHRRFNYVPDVRSVVCGFVRTHMWYEELYMHT